MSSLLVLAACLVGDVHGYRQQHGHCGGHHRVLHPPLRQPEEVGVTPAVLDRLQPRGQEEDAEHRDEDHRTFDIAPTFLFAFAVDDLEIVQSLQYLQHRAQGYEGADKYYRAPHCRGYCFGSLLSMPLPWNIVLNSPLPGVQWCSKWVGLVPRVLLVN